MSIVYEPEKLLQKVAPKVKIEKSISASGRFKKTAFRFLDRFDFISKKSIVDVALKTFKSYKKRIEGNEDLEYPLLSDPKQLVQRVQNAVVYQISREIESKYKGEQYEWLPSDADEPDPEHQLLYGTIRTIGEGEMPGKRYGCKCGMRILVNETKLEI